MARLMAKAALAAALLAAPAARADAVSDFYRGKTINMIVSYGPGGGYDVYGRIVARHIGKYIPGNPNVIVQNMPGAGSVIGANYLYNVAPKDGTSFGIFAREIPLVGLLNTSQTVRYDPRKYTWLGSSSSYANDAYLLMARKDASAKSIDDLRRPGAAPLILGGTAEGVASDPVQKLFRELLGLNLKVIAGYTDSGQLFMAMDRKEIDGRTVGLSAVRSTKPDWLRPEGPMHVLAVFARATRHPDLPNAPTARELARTDRDRQIIEVMELPYTLSRPFAAPPGIPADRAKALQEAFLAVHKDPQFIAQADKLGIDISPIGADEVQRMIERIASTPPELMKSVEKLMSEGG